MEDRTGDSADGGVLPLTPDETNAILGEVVRRGPSGTVSPEERITFCYEEGLIRLAARFREIEVAASALAESVATLSAALSVAKATDRRDWRAARKGKGRGKW